MSNGYLRIIGKAPQRPPRKPKKEKKTKEPSVISDQTSEKKVQEEKPAEEITSKESTTPEAVDTEATEAKAGEVVIASPAESGINSAKQSSQDEDQTQIATEPEAPRDDKVEESEKKNERPA